jgi:hypothetical protein
MRWFPTIRSCVMGGALVAGAAAGISGVASATSGEPAIGLTSAPGEGPPPTIIVVPSAPAAGTPTPGSSADYLQRGIQAQSDADASRQRAAQLATQGGFAREARKANTQATSEQAKADQLFAKAGVPSCQALAPPAPPPSPELKAAQERLDRLRETGGSAYKNGSVARAEAEVEALTPPTQ